MYPKQALSRTIQIFDFSSRIDKFIMHVIITMYINITWEKNTTAFLGRLLPKIVHVVVSEVFELTRPTGTSTIVTNESNLQTPYIYTFYKTL